MEFIWAEEHPDLQSVCKRFSLFELHNPLQVQYKSFKGITQVGPQCGLVALAICMELPSKDTVDRLFQEALTAGYTYNGEMFSCRQMYELTINNVPNKVTLFEGFLDCEEIKDFLLKGGVMLVPYDCDGNHAPSCWSGHKAHWALITGIIVTKQVVYVVAKHGKTNSIAIWDLSKLSESNAQLKEFSPDRNLQKVKYKLPDGGLSGVNGLLCQAVCIWKNL